MGRNVVHSGGGISRSSQEIFTGKIKRDVQHFIIMAREGAHALTSVRVPNLTFLIHGSCCNQGAIPVELRTTDLCFVANERVQTPVQTINNANHKRGIHLLSRVDVPYRHGVVKGSCD